MQASRPTHIAVRYVIRTGIPTPRLKATTTWKMVLYKARVRTAAPVVVAVFEFVPRRAN